MTPPENTATAKPPSASPESGKGAEARDGLSLRHYLDRIFTWVIRVGGSFTVMCVLAIFVYMGLQVLPLFRGPHFEPGRSVILDPIPTPSESAESGEFNSGDVNPQETKGKPLAFSMDENRSVIAQLFSDGKLLVRPITEKEKADDSHLLPVKGQAASFQIALDSAEYLVRGFADTRRSLFAYLTDKGRVGLVRIRYRKDFAETATLIHPEFQASESFTLASTAQSDTGLSAPSGATEPIALAAAESETAGPLLFVAWTDAGETQASLLFFDEDMEAVTEQVALPDLAGIQNVALTQSGARLLASDAQNWLYLYKVDEDGVALEDKWKHQGEILSLTSLFGDQTFVVAARHQGNLQLSATMPITQPQGGRRYEAVHRWTPTPSETELQPGDFQILPYPLSRNFIFLTGEKTGTRASIYESTTGKSRLQTFLKDLHGPVVLDPHGKNIVGLVGDKDAAPREARLVEVSDPHPDFTLAALFSPVQYEGYGSPELSWQSSAGNDEFQHKVSLIPLIFGTLKGTLFALLFSVPLSVGAAIYISHFAPKRLKSVVKPAIELTGSVPSVVIGFLAGIVLAPWLKDHLLWFFLFFGLAPLVLFGFGVILSRGDENRAGGFWPRLARWLNDPVPSTWIFFGSFTLLFLLCFPLEGALNAAFFQGSFSNYLAETLGIRFDTRNGVLIGIALGFAVIPVIFTLAEDALSNVPPSLISASRALGASKWQTIVRVVLLAASPGIFVAIIIGLGRAVGETMIVLMASGNTPILDPSLFTGLRSMSATIAIEIPEAPHGETLYRILFLVGFLLFCFTFFLNLIADVYSHHLKKKFGSST